MRKLLETLIEISDKVNRSLHNLHKHKYGDREIAIDFELEKQKRQQINFNETMEEIQETIEEYWIKKFGHKPSLEQKMRLSAQAFTIAENMNLIDGMMRFRR